MTVRLTMLTYSDEAHIRRLRLDPTEELAEQMAEFREFGGSPHDATDLERINMVLPHWGVQPDSVGWRDQDGGWVVPILSDFASLWVP
ncbi:hypothetical protein [Rhodococcus sp. X156]|uniref:hypothetical protein n=1 Tax=Rhodococcus sp. X156 TaxID=2499145 RepID=UPI000FDA4EE6|nr:hypothetical protein [Rhodococcus sp. X156]